jgi:hypothetical protein
MTIASLKDPTNARVAPHGITNLQVMSIVPPDPTAWGVNEEEARSRNYRRSEGYRHHKLVYARSLMRSIFDFSAENAKIAWMAEGAVCCEPFSTSDFPDHQGKYRKFRRSRAILHKSGLKSPRVRCAFLRNSLTIITGNFDRGSGNVNSLIRIRSGNCFANSMGQSFIRCE